MSDPKVSQDSRCHWSQVLVLGELKSNPDIDGYSETWLDLERYAQEVLLGYASLRSRIYSLWINHTATGV
jgi:Fungal protein kinase